MIKTIERRSFHAFDKDSGIVSFPNRFELRSDDNKNFLGIYTAKRNDNWFLGINISLTDRAGVNRTLSWPCSFKNTCYLSEKDSYRAVLVYLRKPGIGVPKKWLKEIDAHISSLHDR